MLTGYKEILVKSAADKVISKIRFLIDSGELLAGDKLPSERNLATKYGVGRAQVRDAIAKLEFYGLVKTLPQSGTFIERVQIMPIDGLITKVLKIEESTFSDLVATRVILETQAVKMAAIRRTDQDIEMLTSALEAYEYKIKQGKSGLAEDLIFHLKIADACHNEVLKSLMMVIIPDIIKYFTKLEICSKDGTHKPLEEHKELLNYIIEGNEQKAVAKMKDHLKDVVTYSQVVSEKSKTN